MIREINIPYYEKLKRKKVQIMFWAGLLIVMFIAGLSATLLVEHEYD